MKILPILLISVFLLIACNTPPSQNLIDTSELNVGECSELDMQEDRELCYLRLGREKQDLSLCEAIQEVSSRDFCLEGVGIVGFNIEACEKMTKGLQRDACFKHHGEVKVNTDICEKIQAKAESEGGYTQDSCFKNVAIKLEDEGICSRIIDQLPKDLCLLEVAKRKKDHNICDSIDSPIWKSNCLGNDFKSRRELCENNLPNVPMAMVVLVPPNTKVESIPYVRHSIISAVPPYGKLIIKPNDRRPCRWGTKNEENSNFLYCYGSIPDDSSDIHLVLQVGHEFEQQDSFPDDPISFSSVRVETTC